MGDGGRGTGEIQKNTFLTAKSAGNAKGIKYRHPGDATKDIVLFLYFHV